MKQAKALLAAALALACGAAVAQGGAGGGNGNSGAGGGNAHSAATAGPTAGGDPASAPMHHKSMKKTHKAKTPMNDGREAAEGADSTSATKGVK